MEKVRSEQEKSKSDESLKLAVAMAIVRSNLLHKSPAPPPQPSSSVDALKWKQKAKERKREILRLKEDLKVAEDGSQCDIYPKSASCKCYFFDKLGSTRIGDGSDQRFSDVLRRRFLRQVRIKERKTRRTDDSLLQRISGTLATMSPMERNAEPVEGIINSLIMRLLRRMCSALQGDENHHFDTAVQFYIQHLMRKIGNEAFVGLRLIFAVSQRISVVAESLLFMDPFDVAYPSMHNSMYMMIQLIEFLVSDYLLTWSNAGDFDIKLFEEWVGSILHGRKALELLENRNSLYVLYIDRVIGVVTRQVGQLSFQQKLNPQILENLFS
ncbi:protein MULTIPOLAR SPINDLE 1-like isoform X2 [Lycium ferocissimum]|uniref:protein MULTIPOLAR SPINDLE 1-like isoform X2 n=1 Tax=Lycium ferocissimum TaxID=112874 RepID=UPI002814D87E|nr:protein MULTIPOLAR SPINDLE 1-like isoform X2 [Lycium ferocissimum]